MRDYYPGDWGFNFLFSLDGSVFPRAFVVALPNACIAALFWYLWRKTDATHAFESASGVSIGQVWSAFNFIIGFVVSFRASQSYSRWWEGGTLLQQARGEWFNAYSSLIAFCSYDPEKEVAVGEFQHALSRLVSLLHASALLSVSTEVGIDFEVIDTSGIDDVHLAYLRAQADKCEVIMQWVQRLIVNNMQSGVLPIPPPVISRVFQELSRGIVNIHNVRKITEFQFPFPLAQLTMTMLLVQWCATPFVCSLLVDSPIWAAALSFFPIFACWGVNYVAGEIEQPFGVDPNDMPMHFMQAAMNTSIIALLDPEAQIPPTFDMSEAQEQCVFAEPSKVAGGLKPLPEMRSALFLTVQDIEQMHNISTRFCSTRRSQRHRKRFEENTSALKILSSSRPKFHDHGTKTSFSLYSESTSSESSAQRLMKRWIRRSRLSQITRNSSWASQLAPTGRTSVRSKPPKPFLETLASADELDVCHPLDDQTRAGRFPSPRSGMPKHMSQALAASAEAEISHPLDDQLRVGQRTSPTASAPKPLLETLVAAAELDVSGTLDEQMKVRQRREDCIDEEALSV